MKRTGKCLCGAVRLTVDRDSHDLGVCHCINCKRWAGGPFFEVECGKDVVFEGAESISSFQSSPWAERGFCKACGSHLFIKSIESGEYGIPPGLFANDEGILFTRQVFVDHKPAYYSFADATRNMTSDYIYERHPHIRGGSV